MAMVVFHAKSLETRQLHLRMHDTSKNWYVDDDISCDTTRKHIKFSCDARH